MPTALMETSSGFSVQTPDESEQQGDIAKIKEIGRPIIQPINGNEHRHESGVSKLEPERNPA
jgi:uncharacterized protein YjlB